MTDGGSSDNFNQTVDLRRTSCRFTFPISPQISCLASGTGWPYRLIPLLWTPAGRWTGAAQRALTRYYCDAGVGGLAVGVHTTQFAIREVGLYEPVLKMAAETAAAWTDRQLAMVAGLAGPTPQASREAEIAVDLGYHAGLLSLGAMRDASEDEIIEHCRSVSRTMPLFGFYLQPAVGGRHLPRSFWKRFCEIENVVGIKIAPFNRYRTIDVVQGLVDAGAEDRITLYTGNDDHIVLDLLAPFIAQRGGEAITVRIKGGLLGHWSVWTRAAVELFERCKAVRGADAVSNDLLALDSRVNRDECCGFRCRETIFTAASPDATRCCAGRACWKASGVSIRRRAWAVARARLFSGSSATMPI